MYDTAQNKDLNKEADSWLPQPILEDASMKTEVSESPGRMLFNYKIEDQTLLDRYTNLNEDLIEYKLENVDC